MLSQQTRGWMAVIVSVLGALWILNTGVSYNLPNNDALMDITATSTKTLKPSKTPTRTNTPFQTSTPTEEAPTVVGTTLFPPTATSTPAPPIEFTPYPNAPLCPAHDNSTFHALWNSVLGCHYDHEHGASPFTQEVVDNFPGFNLFALLGNVQVGHTNPSSPMENTHKHGGNKWGVQLHHPQTCAGFESALTGIDGSVIQFHGFGDYAIEAEVRIHSTVALLRQCKTSNPTDYGYVFVNQLQDYGQRIVPYQGTIVNYPNQPVPAFQSISGPYLSFGCLDLTSPHVIQCRESFAQALLFDAASVWTSKPTGDGHSESSPLFRILWRVRDTYRLFDWNDQDYPFNFFWLCTSDDGATHNPDGCEYNNTTTQVHEVAGTVPTAWDNLAGWDTNPMIGRITAQGFVDVAGDINPDCTAPNTNCFPVKLVNAFTGVYGSVLVFTTGKGVNVVPVNPKRDIYFCAGLTCAEIYTGAVPSGWIGPNN